ncbi:MAG: glycosyltransferase [Candidatus Gottesmanbacteria bacterium]|nr:glycosyltransferase [Candidatus Gottesmanbacteria bacterium]
MSQKPTISIIIPTLNEEKFLPHLLDSLMEQHDQDFEVIIVDGESGDKTVEVAQLYIKKVPHLSIVHAGKAGVSYQKNLGVGRATGDYLVFIDADVILYPYCIERIRTYISDGNHQFFTPWYSPDTSNPSDVAVSLLAIGMIEGALMVKKPIAAGVVGVTKALFERTGGYDQTRTFGEDYDLTQKLARLGIPLTIIRETLYIQSFRRYREQGRMRFLQVYAKGILRVLITGQSPKHIRGYELGGQIYRKKKRPTGSVIRIFQKGYKKLLKDMLS